MRTMSGIAYPLYFNFLPSYLATKFTEDSSLSLTYRNYCIESAVGIVGPLSAAFLVNTWFGRRWMMGMSAIVTGIFLFSYASVKTAAASLAFACITGMLANFGRFNCPRKSSEEREVADPSYNRVRGHVRLHARVLSRSASRNWNRNCSGFATLRWTGGQFDFIVHGIHHGSDLCECVVMDCGWSSLFRAAV